MGRKPNQLILEHFERGPKLEDNSNRYQHTCKSCGEKFPKGRIDSLTNHLVKKCPALALRTRQRVLLQLNDLPDLAKSDPGSGKERGLDMVNNGKTVELPYANREPNRLELLAEASRQATIKETEGHDGLGSRLLSEEEGWTNGTAPPNVHPSHIDPRLTEAPLPPIQYLGSMSDSPTSSPHLPGISTPAMSAHASSSLCMTTQSTDDFVQPASATFTMEIEPTQLGVPNECISDKFFHVQGPRTSTWPMIQQSAQADMGYSKGSREQNGSHEISNTRAATFPRAIAMNPNAPQRGFSAEFNTSSKPSKPKVRGRFTPSRRKEVQEVRKRGACIRCRILKKPCSGDNPCLTCKSVESARLWKQPCIRTRIAEEMELYSAGLHAVLAYHEITHAKSQAKFLEADGHIEATHYYDTSIFVTFTFLTGQRQPIGSQGEDGHANFDEDFKDLYLLDSEDDVPSKLEQYMNRMATIFEDREPSLFMKPTLNLARELSVEKKDLLLARVLELWTATHILVDLEMQWQIFSNLPSIPQQDSVVLTPPQKANGTDSGYVHQVIDDETNARTYALLCSQLRSATEKRAAQLSKSVMNDLERKLVQRQQSGWFETFIVAIVLLNCVERTSWLFKSWEGPHFYSKWPLDKRPPHYLQQGEHFADILHMLLKVRGGPARAQPRPEDGVLAAVEGSEETVSRYFDTICISTHQLERRQDAQFDPTDSRSLELKYCSKLLLPTT